MKLLSILFLLLLSQITLAENRYILEGKKSVAAGARFFSCLAYQGCGQTYFSIGRENRVHIVTDKTHEKVMSEFSKCDLPLEQIKYIKRVTKDNKYVSIKIDQSSEEKLDLTPAILKQVSKEDLNLLLKKIKSLKTSEEILDLAKDFYGFTFHDYSYDFKAAKKVAVTVHEEKRVTFSDLKLYTPLSALLMIRHELEHIQQNKMVETCKHNTVLKQHNLRERSAYLNDMYFREYYGFDTAVSIKNLNRYLSN